MLSRTRKDDGDASLKRRVMGRQVVVTITEGKLGFRHGSRFSIRRGFVKTIGKSNTTYVFNDRIA